METIPLHVLSEHVCVNFPDIDVVARLSLTNKEWHSELKDKYVPTCLRELQSIAPELCDLFNEKTPYTLERCITQIHISFPTLIRVLKQVKQVQTRVKGERFRHLLDPFLDGSLLIYKEDLTDADVTVTMAFLFSLVVYSTMTKAVDAMDQPYPINLMFWTMFTVYDYLWRMYERGAPCDILNNWFFKHLMLLNLQEVTTRPYKRHLGASRAYMLERIMQKTKVHLTSSM